jgi:hypothetical protein
VHALPLHQGVETRQFGQGKLEFRRQNCQPVELSKAERTFELLALAYLLLKRGRRQKPLRTGAIRLCVRVSWRAAVRVV